MGTAPSTFLEPTARPLREWQNIRQGDMIQLMNVHGKWWLGVAEQVTYSHDRCAGFQATEGLQLRLNPAYACGLTRRQQKQFGVNDGVWITYEDTSSLEHEHTPVNLTINLRRSLAATKIQNHWRRCISDPSFLVARERLRREFESLKEQEQQDSSRRRYP